MIPITGVTSLMNTNSLAHDVGLRLRLLLLLVVVVVASGGSSIVSPQQSHITK